jgi:hypothetical protein
LNRNPASAGFLLRVRLVFRVQQKAPRLSLFLNQIFWKEKDLKPINSTEREANFKRWFGDSKVVDAEGKPLVVYHGTQGDFDAFRDDIEGRSGFYFTSDKVFANSFAEGDGVNVMPAYLSIAKPADLRRGVPGSVYNSLEGQGYSRLVELYESDPQEIWNFFDGDTELSDALQRAGYDGLQLSEPTGRREVFSWVALRPQQIKSATGNRGTFDPCDHNITH